MSFISIPLLHNMKCPIFPWTLSNFNSFLLKLASIWSCITLKYNHEMFFHTHKYRTVHFPLNFSNLIHSLSHSSFLSFISFYIYSTESSRSQCMIESFHIQPILHKWIIHTRVSAITGFQTIPQSLISLLDWALGNCISTIRGRQIYPPSVSIYRLLTVQYYL